MSKVVNFIAATRELFDSTPERLIKSTPEHALRTLSNHRHEELIRDFTSNAAENQAFTEFEEMIRLEMKKGQ